MQMSPAAGYFFKERIATCLRAGNDSDTYTAGGDKSRQFTISVAPFFSYYFFQSDQKVNWFSDVAYGYFWSK